MGTFLAALGWIVVGVILGAAGPTAIVVRKIRGKFGLANAGPECNH